MSNKLCDFQASRPLWWIHSSRPTGILLWPEPRQLCGDPLLSIFNSLSSIYWPEFIKSISYPMAPGAQSQSSKLNTCCSEDSITKGNLECSGNPEHVPDQPLPPSPHRVCPRCTKGSSVLGNRWDPVNWAMMVCSLWSPAVQITPLYVQMTSLWRPVVPSNTFLK